MILSIYLTILAISLVFIFLGYMLGNNADIFKYTGFAFLFILSVLIIPGTPGELTYISGSVITETATGFTITETLSTYEDLTIGFFLSIASVFGFINCFYMTKNGDFSE